MNELFSFHKELNIKKIIIAAFIIIFIIILLIEIISGLFKGTLLEAPEISTNTYHESQSPNNIFYDSNKKLSIELSKQYKLIQKDSNTSNNHIIELSSPDNLYINISSVNNIQDKPLSQIANADKASYIENFASNSNISEVSEFTLNDTIGQTYSFHYLDSKTNTSYYLQVVWLQVQNEYYVFDVEFPLDDINNYTNIINEILNSFKIL